MGLLVSPTQEDIFTVLRAFLLDILPDGIEVVQGQDNRVAEPLPTDFVTMVPTFRRRLSTNVDKFVDCAFSASILNNVMTVAAVAIGSIVPPAQIFSPSFPLNQKFYILAQLSGTPGGAGTYSVTPGTPDVASPSDVGDFVVGQSPIEGTKFASGVGAYLQPTELTVQLDVHGPASADNAQIISTMFRDEFAYDFFVRLNGNVTPFYADDPRQMAFTNEEQQIEDRWVIEAKMQINATVSAPQQFAERVDLGLIEVDATYPP